MKTTGRRLPDVGTRAARARTNYEKLPESAKGNIGPGFRRQQDLARVEGTGLRVKREGSATWDKPTKATDIGPGDQVQASSSARGSITYPDGTKRRIIPGSLVQRNRKP